MLFSESYCIFSVFKKVILDYDFGEVCRPTGIYLRNFGSSRVTCVLTATVLGVKAKKEKSLKLKCYISYEASDGASVSSKSAYIQSWF
jgi:hypothetical protein